MIVLYSQAHQKASIKASSSNIRCLGFFENIEKCKEFAEKNYNNTETIIGDTLSFKKVFNGPIDFQYSSAEDVKDYIEYRKQQEQEVLDASANKILRDTLEVEQFAKTSAAQAAQAAPAAQAMAPDEPKEIRGQSYVLLAILDDLKSIRAFRSSLQEPMPYIKPKEHLVRFIKCSDSAESLVKDINAYAEEMPYADIVIVRMYEWIKLEHKDVSRAEHSFSGSPAAIQFKKNMFACYKQN